MYLLEPILNTFYRIVMKSILQFDQVESFNVPDIPLQARDNCLLYIHVPFCESLCPYCSFHRYVYDEELTTAYFNALWKEMRLYKDRGFDFKSIYIGGGTPTINLPKLEQTMDLARKLFDIREISVETNPNHLVDDKVHVLKEAGVNRLSVGVQTFDDRVLKAIGRLERYGDNKEIRRKLEKTIGVFDTLNVDLIFNMPLQDKASVVRDLDILEELKPEQVTFYPLMTAASVKTLLRKKLGAISYIREKELYFTILERMKRLDYKGSTAWCFSRQATMIDEYIVAYDHYAAAGSGAFGYMGDVIYANSFSIEEYIRKVNKGKFSVSMVRRFKGKEYMLYHFLMKLFGLTLDKNEFREKFGVSYNRGLFPLPLMQHIAGSVTEDANEVRLTDAGKYYWVAAMREFFIAVDTMRDNCRSIVPTSGPEKN